jgi:hypothetical protein
MPRTITDGWILRREPDAFLCEPVLVENHAVAPLLYLDQNYLSGFAKRKPAFRELEDALRSFSGGTRLPTEPDRAAREARRRMDA